MEKTNSESLLEAKMTAAAVSEEKQNNGGMAMANQVTRSIAVVISELSILTLELPWLLNSPSVLKLSLLLGAAIVGGLLFGFGFTVPIEPEKDQESGKDDEISGWPLAGLYFLLSVSTGLIYSLFPGMRINGWLYVLINLVEAFAVGLLGWFFFEISSISGKVARALAILSTIAGVVCAVYLGWPILQNSSLPVLALLLPGIALAEATVSGLFVWLYISLVLMLDSRSKRDRTATILGFLLAIGAAAGTVYLVWPVFQNHSSPVLALLLPGIILCGSVLAGVIGTLVVLPDVFLCIIRGFLQGVEDCRRGN